MLQPLSRQSGDTEKFEETMNDTVALHQITLEGSAHLNEKKSTPELKQTDKEVQGPGETEAIENSQW